MTQDNKEEQQYLDLIKQILENGHSRTDRTGTGTISLFAPSSFRFSLVQDQFPLLTTKRVFLRGIFEELLWILRGKTNSQELKEKGVGIWDQNGSREFLDSLGFTGREVGDLGPVYGFQWRHFGAQYQDCYTDYSGQGIDQLQNLIEGIKQDPYSRRHIITGWNPKDLKLMVLPPCHMFCQFYVHNNDEGKPSYLSSQLYQRSGDIGLGVPFNIASYSLLTKIIASLTGLVAYEFVHVLGDAHVYLDHVDALKVQISRSPRLFPQLKIKAFKDLDELDWSLVEVSNYHPHPKIEMKMSA